MSTLKFGVKMDWRMKKMPNSDEKKMIRFIDSDYNDLFSIPDGGTIFLTYSDGKKAERT